MVDSTQISLPSVRLTIFKRFVLLLILFLLSFLNSFALANSPQLVKDLNPGGGGITVGNNQVMIDDGTIFFFVPGGVTTGLYKTDGTEGGTVLVKELDLRFGERIYDPVSLGDKIVFIYDLPTPQGGSSSDALGWEVWVSDGTEQGTHVIVDLVPGPGSGVVPSTTKTNMKEYNGFAYFGARTQGNDHELWRTDGTATNTALVKDIRPGIKGSVPKDFIKYAGKLYFSASEIIGNPSLWVTDGTEQGTVKINEAPFPDNMNPDRFMVFSGELYFQGAGPNGVGAELIKYNATTDVMTLVKDIRPGSSSNPTPMLATDSLLYFSAITGSTAEGKELWVTDGTEVGTFILKDINPGGGNGLSSNNSELIAEANGTVVFAANDGATGLELWKTDGSTAGTSLFKDIRIGVAGGVDANAGYRFISFGGAVYFSAFDVTPLGRELWRTDGTYARVVRDFAGSFSPSKMRKHGEMILMQGFASNQSHIGNVGIELFKIIPVPTRELKNNQWQQISLPCDGVDTRSVGDIFSDEALGTYGTDWTLFRYDAALGNYVHPSLTDELLQDSGYWFIQTGASDVTVDMPPMCDDSPTTTALVECPSSLLGCYELPLATQSGDSQWQLTGNLFETNFTLGDAIVVTDSGVCGDVDGCTLGEASSAGIVYEKMLSYNGAFYSRVIDSSVLPPWEGTWTATLENADGLNPKMLFPLY